MTKSIRDDENAALMRDLEAAIERYGQVRLGEMMGTRQQNVSRMKGAGRMSADMARVFREQVLHETEERFRERHGLTAAVPLAEPVRLAYSRGRSPSTNALVALAAYDWEGVARADYDAVHKALAGAASVGGVDPVPSWWTAEIRRVLRERGAPAVTRGHGETDAEDPDVAAHKAQQKASKTPKKPG